MKSSRRFAAFFGICVFALGVASAHAEVAVRSGLQEDKSFQALSPIDQLKKIAELSKGGQRPADAELLGVEAVYRYLQQEAKGDPAASLAAYQKLLALGQTELAGAPYSDLYLTDQLVAAALLADPKFQAADAKTRLQMLRQLEDGGIRGPFVSTLEEWTIYEHVALRTAGLAVKDRGLAKLKALAELAADNQADQTAVDESGAGRIWTCALAEHLAYYPGWDTMPASERVEYLAKLYADVKMNMWGGSAERSSAAVDALRSDPAWASASVEDRVKLAKAFASKYAPTGFLGQYLESYAKGKIEPQNTKPPLDDILAALGDTTDAAAALMKLQTLRAEHSLPRAQYNAISLRLAMRYVGGDGTKPITPDTENAKWVVSNQDRKPHPLGAVDRNEVGAPELASQVAQVVLDPKYAKATWPVRATLVDATTRKYDVFGSSFPVFRAMAIQFAAAAEAAKAPPAQRGVTRLKAIAKFYAKETNANLQDSYVQRQVADALNEHFAANPATGKARFTQLQAMLKQKLLVAEIANDVIAQATLDMLQADPAFVKADAAGKKAMVEQLQKSNTINFFSASIVKRALRL